MNTRRKWIVALGATALVSPLSSFAQPATKVWRVGFLSPRHVDFTDADVYYGPFRRGMRELGYVEGKNLVIEWRSAEGNYERLPGLASGMADLKVDVIVAAGSLAISAAQKATTTIPIVMGGSPNPVGSGFVKSLARPEGNITGLSTLNEEVRLKQLEMLLAIVPRLSRAAILLNSANTANATSAEKIIAEGQKRGVTIVVAEARSSTQIDQAFASMRRQKTGAVIIFNEALFQQQKNQIAELTATHRLPAVAGDRIFSEAGVLMSYGGKLAYQYHRVATYVDKIFKGAKPADLPVEQPTIFELIVNGKTAKALGLKIPQSLLIMADKVIQ